MDLPKRWIEQHRDNLPAMLETLEKPELVWTTLQMCINNVRMHLYAMTCELTACDKTPGIMGHHRMMQKQLRKLMRARLLLDKARETTRRTTCSRQDTSC